MLRAASPYHELIRLHSSWASGPRRDSSPPQLNLVLELEFAEADALRPGEGSTDYTIENVRVLAGQVTLDSALHESYQKILGPQPRLRLPHHAGLQHPRRQHLLQRHGGSSLHEAARRFFQICAVWLCYHRN